MLSWLLKKLKTSANGNLNIRNLRRGVCFEFLIQGELTRHEPCMCFRPPLLIKQM